MDVHTLENKLSKAGKLYHDTKNDNAFTFKNKKTSDKFIWTKGEEYGQFLRRCFNFLNVEENARPKEGEMKP